MSLVVGELIWTLQILPQSVQELPESAKDSAWILKYNLWVKHLWSSLIQKMSKEKSLINEASNGTASQAILNAVIDSVEQQTERES